MAPVQSISLWVHAATIVCIFQAVESGTPPNYKGIYWTHHANLPAGFQIKWTNVDPEWFIMEMSAPTKGYVGVGFSRTGGMAGSDIALGWVDESGHPHFKDYHGTHNGAPVEDVQQDYELIYASEDEKGTKIVFRRKWDTCDDKDMEIGEDTMRLIWAWSEYDPPDNTFLQHHGRGDHRGARSMFMKTQPKPVNFPDADPNTRIKHWDITMNNFRVPSKETHYHCKIFKFPKSARKLQMVGYRPLISDEIFPYIHHINVLNCHVPEYFGKTKDFMEKYLTHESTDCFQAPKEWNDFCYAFRAAHGIGGEGELFPPYLGNTIYDPEEGDSYFRLEVHYENPYGAQLIDSSGIRIFYTEELRKYEISMLFVGHRRSPFLTIPPHQDNFKITGHCSGECTGMGLQETGIKIHSVLLHAHLRGKALILRHIRNGKELEPIAYDNHYDFNYQEYRTLIEERQVLPGDELIVECDYETVNNDTFIFGGLSTKREMCEAFIFYYPKTTLVDCRSQPELNSYLAVINVSQVNGDLLTRLNLPYDPMNMKEEDRDKAIPDDSAVLDLYSDKQITSDVFNSVRIQPSNKDLQDYMDNLNWKDNAFVSKVESGWRSGPRYMHCAKHGGIRLPNKHILEISKYSPYQMKPKLCLRSGSPSYGRLERTTTATLFASIVMLFFLK